MNDMPDAGRFALGPSRDDAETLEWLSVLFAAPPSLEAIASYRRGPAAAMLDRLAADPDLALGVAALRRELHGALDDAALAAKIGMRFVLIFEGVAGPMTVSPYESAHRFDGRLFQAPTAEMAALLAAHDISISPDVAEPADHIAIELALAARLTAADDPDAAAMTQRLAAWVPLFAAACIAASGGGFWAGAAHVLGAVVARANRAAVRTSQLQQDRNN